MGPRRKFILAKFRKIRQIQEIDKFSNFTIILANIWQKLCVASESMLSGQVEGAADFLIQTLAPFHFHFPKLPFRPGNLGLFGALLQPPAPEKKYR